MSALSNFTHYWNAAGGHIEFIPCMLPSPLLLHFLYLARACKNCEGLVLAYLQPRLLELTRALTIEGKKRMKSVLYCLTVCLRNHTTVTVS